MKKILLIEDDQILRENVAEMLSLSGYYVIAAPDGKHGIEAALKEKPDLILCDVMMPGIDGYGVLHILSRHPEGGRIPFVFLTGRSDREDFRRGLELGADDYLIKPFHETELLNTVDLRLRKSDKLKNLPDSVSADSIFAIDLSEKNRENLFSGKNESLQFKKKHTLFTEAQRASSVYFVLSGKLKEYRLHETGKELITNIFSEGDFIGHNAVLEGVNYSENVEVIEDAELLVVPAKEFTRLIRSDRNFANHFLGLLSHDIRKKEEKLLNIAYNSLRKKVAIGIIEVAEKFKGKLDGQTSISISREDLAHVVGSAQESMIRTLKEFKNEKLIDIQEGHIVVLNEQKLRNLLY